MQTLGRVAIVGGGIGVAAINIFLFDDVGSMAEGEKIAVYTKIYQLAMFIPLISVSGVVLAEILKRLQIRKLVWQGIAHTTLPLPQGAAGDEYAAIRPDWWILGGSLGFVLFTLVMGLKQVPFN